MPPTRALSRSVRRGRRTRKTMYRLKSETPLSSDVNQHESRSSSINVPATPPGSPISAESGRSRAPAVLCVPATSSSPISEIEGKEPEPSDRGVIDSTSETKEDASKDKNMQPGTLLIPGPGWTSINDHTARTQDSQKTAIAPAITVPHTTVAEAAVRPTTSTPQWREQLNALQERLAQPSFSKLEPRVGSTQRVPHGLPRSKGQAVTYQDQQYQQPQQPTGPPRFFGVAFTRLKEFIRARLTDNDRDLIRIIVTLNQLSRTLPKDDAHSSRFEALPIKAQMQAVWFWVEAQDKMALFDMAIILHISQDFLWGLVEHFARYS